MLAISEEQFTCYLIESLAVDADMGNLFFHIWAFLVLMILLNIFVAILMDGYALAQEEGVITANQNGQEEPESVLMDVAKFMVILRTCVHVLQSCIHVFISRFCVDCID